MSEKLQKFPAQFLGPSYSGRVKRANAERTVNMYLELNLLQTNANQETGCLIGTPGLTLLNSLGTGPIRAIHTDTTNDAVWVISGNTVYLLYGTTTTDLSRVITVGTMLTSTGYVSVSDNGSNIVFVDGQYGYVSTLPKYLTSTIVLSAFVSAGTQYTNGTYTNYPIAGGNGTGMTANIVIAGNAVISFTVTNYGTGYQVGDQLNINALGDTAFTETVVSCPLTLAQITSTNFYPSGTVCFQDGYFIFNQVGTSYFFLSNLNSANFQGLNEENKSGEPDYLQAVVNVNRILYLLGTNTTETWWDSGQSGSSPFARQDGQFNEIGCIAPATAQKLMNNLVWLGRSPEGGGVVYQMQNSVAVRISNHALEYYIQSLNLTQDLTSSTAYSWQNEGHYFYVLNLPGADTTWVYDASTGQWFEQQSNIQGVVGRHLGQCHAYYNGFHLIGDYTNGNVYYYDFSNYTDNGLPITRIRQSPHLVANMVNMFYKVFQIDFTPGTGISYGLNNARNPSVFLQLSDDGGETWSNPILASIGKLGSYTSRARWQRLGYARDRIFRVSCSDPVKFDIVSAMLDFEVGSA